ncbi:ABC transporter permease [Planctomycetota bacterium]|nr:ABC transporter permease [Planctomycetota bacterium]
MNIARELYQHRDLMRLLMQSSLLKSTSGTKLGALWWVIDPLLMTLVYVVLVQFIRGGGKLLPAYPVFVMCGLVAWKCTATCLSASITKMITSDRLIKSYSFPIISLPISAVLVNFYLFFIAIIPLFGFTLVYHYVLNVEEVNLGWTIVLLPIVILPHLMITIGLTLMFCTLAVFVQDVANMTTHIMRIGWYFSAGLYSISQVMPDYKGLWAIEEFTWKHILILNPMVHVLEAYRSVLIYVRMPDFSALAVLYVLGFIFIALGYRVFNHYQIHFAKVL